MHSTDNNAPTPQTELNDNTTVNYKLFKVSGIGLATFLGSMFAGGLLMSLNFQRLGQETKAKQALLYSGLATLFVIIVVSSIPESVDIPNTILTVPQIILVLYFAKNYQTTEIDAHIENGGLAESNWKAAGIALLVLIPLLLVIFSVLYLLS